MEPYSRGTAEIRHHVTGVVYEIDAEDLEWEQNGGDERGMGPETRYEAVVEHPELGTLTWAIWEYPVGAYNRDDTDVGPHEVVSNFDLGLDHIRDDEDDLWVDYDVPENPYVVFTNSYFRTGDLLADHGIDDGRYLLNRMIFSHQITAMEAYLGDTLINETLGDLAAMDRLMKQDHDLKDIKLTLAEISATPDIVRKKVREHLRGVMYHNLKKVDALYAIALQFRILPQASDAGDLFKAIMLRHDCVHRNGYDKDGAEITVFTKEFVQQTADMIRSFVMRIEERVRIVKAGRRLDELQ